MPRKIFDILPPKEIEEEKEVFFPKKRKLPKFALPAFLRTFFLKRTSILFSISILVSAGLISYFVLPKAEIEIWPEAEVLAFQTTFGADNSIHTTDFPAQLIPGKIFEAEESVLDEFLSSGPITKEKKAEGVIRIYNDCSRSQVLVATTRFQAPQEKFLSPLDKAKGENPWFRITQRVTIPAKSFIETKVVADSPGSKYNIESSTFSVPGLAGGPMYTCIYGKSFQPMRGGLLEEVLQVTEEDLSQAKEIMIEKAEETVENTLRMKIPSDFVLSEETIETEILHFSSSADIDTETEKFVYRVKASAKTLAFKKQDFEGFVKDFISLKIPSGKKLYQESLTMNYLVEETDLESGKLSLSLTGEAKIYSDIDEINLKRALKGKSLIEAKLFLENHSLITKAKLEFWPFWVKKVPQSDEKIMISLRVD